MIWTPRKKLITPRRLQRGNIVYHTDADPLFSQVTFLMDCETAAVGSVNIAPNVGPSLNWSVVLGSAVDGEISNAQAKFGTRSIYTQESAGAHTAGWASDVTRPGSEFAFTGDFTLETHIYIVDKTSVIELMASWDFGDREWRWSLEAGNGRMNFQTSTSGSNNQTPVAQNNWLGSHGELGPPNDQWVHLALCRSGDDFYAFWDGQLSDQSPSNQAIVINVPTTCYFVTGQEQFEGGAGTVEHYMDNLRITDGTARYTSNFTPPTEPYPTF